MNDKLFEAWAYCDELDKSTEFMLQYMQDFAKTDFDTVMNFITKTTEVERTYWYTCNPNWYKKYKILNNDNRTIKK